MTRVHVVALVGLCLMCGQTVAWGQEKPNSLKAGAWLLQFSDKTAVRGAVTMNTDNVEVDEETPGAPTATTRVDVYGALISLDLLKYLRPDARWSFFLGFGPIGGFGYRHEETNAGVDTTPTWPSAGPSLRRGGAWPPRPRGRCWGYG
jgi:hypothetical protein